MFFDALCASQTSGEEWHTTQEYGGRRRSGGTGMGQVWGRPRTKEDIAVREARETRRVKGRFWELLEQGWCLEGTGVAEQSLGGGGGHSA